MSLQDAVNRFNTRTHSQGRQQDIEQAAYESFRQLFGRDPSETEFAQSLPAFDSSANAGQSYLAQYKNTVENSPEGQQKKFLEQYNADPAKWNQQIGGMFSTSLGREATEAEKKHFGSLLASGQVDEYGLNQFLQALPEYRQKQDTEFRNTQRGEFEKADTQYYTDKLLPAIQAQMAQSGRSLESSGYASAMAQAAKQQSQEREKYLTNLSSQQYLGRTGDARKDYESYIGQLGENRQRNYGLQDQLQGRSNQYADYNLQRDAYDQFLSRYGKQKKDWMDYTTFGLNSLNTAGDIYGKFRGGGMGGGGFGGGIPA